MLKAWAGRAMVARPCLRSGHGAGAMAARAPNARAWAAGGRRGGWMCTQAHGGGDPPPPAAPADGEEAPGPNPAARQAYREDMATSYGVAYATRSSEEGYGERYGEAVKAVLEKREDAKTEMQRGETAERNQTLDSVVDVEYETTQGEPVAQREVARHSEQHAAFESEKTAHKRSEEMGSRGGGAT